MSKYDELKAAAEAAKTRKPEWYSLDGHDWFLPSETMALMALASPAAILGLIEEVEVLREKASELSVEAVRYRYLATNTWSDDVTDALCTKDKEQVGKAVDAAVLEAMV